MNQQDIDQLIENNRAWAQRQTEENPGYFTDLAEQQSPKFLWIGCSDSRVPANVVTGLAPGEVFVHRNISNRVVNEDSNIQAVLQYAITALKVEHIIVCGHYGCGGVQAALNNETDGYVRNWVEPIRRSALRHNLCQPSTADSSPVDSAKCSQESWDRACELNVLDQISKLEQNPFVQEARRQGQPLSLHGWIYRLENGIIQILDA